MTSGSGSPGAGGDTGGSRRGASSGAGSPAGGFDGAGSSMGGLDGSSTDGGAGSSGDGGGGRLVMAIDGATPVPAWASSPKGHRARSTLAAEGPYAAASSGLRHPATARIASAAAINATIQSHGGVEVTSGSVTFPRLPRDLASAATGSYAAT